MKVLVTGAAGFIGFHVSRALLARGDRVIGIDNLNDYYDPNLKGYRRMLLEQDAGFRFVRLDIADRRAMGEFFEQHRPELVVHLAAQAGVRYSLENPHAYVESNLVGFVNVLEECRAFAVDHLVYASSSSVYGLSRDLPFSLNDRADRPVSLYGATKRANELMAHAYSHLFALPVTGLRFFTVYGPWGRPDMAYFKFADAITEGRPIDVYNHGGMKRDFTYIDDVVEGVLAVLDKTPATPLLFNIGSTTSVELPYFICLLERELGKKTCWNFVDMQAGDVRDTCADTSDLEKYVGFSPKTSIEAGIARFVAWYKEWTLCTRPAILPTKT